MGTRNVVGKRGRYFIQDTIFSCLGSLFTFLLIRWITEPSYGFTAHLLVYMAGALAFSITGYLLSGLTREVRSEATSWGGNRVVLAVLIKEAGMLGLLISPLTGDQSPIIILLAILADFVLSLGLIAYPRALASQVRKEDKELRSLPDTLNTLVYGTDQKALEMARRAELSGRYCVMGLLTRDPSLNGKVIDEFIIYAVDTEDSMEKLQWRLGGIDCVLYPKDSGFNLPSAPDKTDREDPGEGKENRHTLEEYHTIGVKDPMNAPSRMVKRSFDAVLSGTLLLVFAPLMGLCALSILLEDGCPVIYRQERLGRGGKPFDILKFRTMRTDAEKSGPALYSGDEDPRLTRVGRFLRQHHLDELPQLWNVFKGDMSFIGYRPERKYFIDQIMQLNPRYRYLYQIRPGVTSYATLYNGYTDSVEKMLRRLDLDLYYLRNHSIGFDIRILALTFLSIARGKKF